MSDADDTDFGEAVEVLGEILRLKAGITQCDPQGKGARFTIKSLKALARKASRTRRSIEAQLNAQDD